MVLTKKQLELIKNLWADSTEDINIKIYALAETALHYMDRAEKVEADSEKWEGIANDLYDNIGNPIPGERDEQLVAIKAYEKAKEELK